MKDLLNCPNCGAPIQNDICPYCGSVFLDWTTLDMGKPTFVRIKDRHGMYRLVRLFVRDVEYVVDDDSFPYYCEDIPIETIIKTNYARKINAIFECVPFRFRNPKGDRMNVYEILLDPDKADKEGKELFVKGACE